MISRLLVLLSFVFLNLNVHGQKFTDLDIKKLADQVNLRVVGVNVGNGIKAKGCRSVGRTLIYQFDVEDYWEAPVNLKDEVISNLRKSGAAKTYYLQNIDVNFFYYNRNTLIKKVFVNSNELSPFSAGLGEYISIKGHSKSKFVDLKLKVPKGWDVKEGDRPNVVKKFTYGSNSYLILIKDNVTFFSRRQVKEALLEEGLIENTVNEFCELFEEPKVIDKTIVTVDRYPTVYFKIKGKMEHIGLKFSVIMKCWVVFYEDKIIYLQAMGTDNSDFIGLDNLYAMITNSVIFPEQYESK